MSMSLDTNSPRSGDSLLNYPSHSMLECQEPFPYWIAFRVAEY